MKIWTTVPTLPRNMQQERGCESCGQIGGKLSFVQGSWWCEICKRAFSGSPSRPAGAARPDPD